MKITFERERMLTAYQTAAMVSPTRSPISILNNVKLEVSPEGSSLMATDMEVGIRIDVDGVTVETPGAAILPTSRFGNILRESSDEKISLEADVGGIVVRGERSEFKLPAESADEYPKIQSFGEEQFCEVPARLFKELVKRTLFATDTESSRYALGGVLLEFEADKITAVGTDGRRLSKMEGPAHLSGPLVSEAMTIIPSRSMQLIDRALSDADAEIQVAARANDVLVKSPRATIYSRLVEGRFPKWREVFPTRQEAIQISISVGPMYSALRQASVVTSEDSRGIDFSFGEGSLVMSGSTAEIGESRVEFPISYDGSPVTVTLDHRFVADFLKVLDPEKSFTLEIENSESAAVFLTDDGYGYVVMPLARDR